ncbi:hypothetical protein [Nocardia sp. CDC160]|uniref:hypothetical protein n=1 Tax=Nocardia sp. CDC160 TaxID=3112166 RepID=UPI002DBC679E|nr:hypothetical protein [Nocardia sp. CDC160]MEC3920316.1 hypothetical protein [Nocardia sp. CDC160]
MKTVRSLAAIFLAGSAFSLIPMGAAHAASAGDAAQICGSGYWPIDQVTLAGAVIYLSYDGGTDCVVTMKTAFVGQLTKTEAAVKLAGTSSGKNDTGQYYQYAGPVRLYAPHQCIQWGGAALNPDGSMGGALSPASHCG